MSDTIQSIANYFIELPFWELIAVFTALLYVVFAAKENIWCWPAALVSTMIYTVIFYDVYLWMDSILQVYYLGMAVYGWYCWNQRTKTGEHNLQVQSWHWQLHAKIIIALTFVALALGWLMDTYTPTDFPFLDSATTVFAVFATYLVAQKVLENWWYWIVIDLVSIYLYVEKSLLPTAVLFAVYVVMCVYGYLSWRKNYTNRNAEMKNCVATNG